MAADRIPYLHIYEDDDGESHQEYKYVELTTGSSSGNSIGRLSELFPASGLIFRSTPADYDFKQHNAPRRQWIVCLDAGVTITTSDGAVNTVGAGGLIKVEDINGKGHSSKSADGKPRSSIFIPIPDDA